MRCPQCGVDNQAGKNYCGDCGVSLAITCAFCGSANPGDENGYCRVCGTVLDRAGFAEPVASWRGGGSGGSTGEIRPVTVLYCDIVGSTALTRRIGAEAMHALLNRFLDTAAGEVERYGGNVAEFTGDGFMALFGAPLTQEDHVRRALLSAIAVRNALRQAGETDGQRPPDFQIRIGIDSGPVVFGTVGLSFRTKTAIGDAANSAARLQQVASPGEILVSKVVRSLAQGYATFEPVGPLTVPGKSEVVIGYGVLEVSRWRTARDAVAPNSRCWNTCYGRSKMAGVGWSGSSATPVSASHGS
jgi:class 3 adenylate cyclase